MGSYLSYARHISALLVGMYGVVPLLVDLFGIYEVPYANINLIFSAFLFCSIYVLPARVPLIKHPFKFDEKKNIFLTIVVFVSALYCFYLFPWSEDRESFGASVSAFFRALWFVVGVSYIAAPERSRFIVMISTVILMYVDQSRTYFLLLLLILSVRSDYKKAAIFFGVFFAITLAAIRSDFSSNNLDFLIFGIVGESYNATITVGQMVDASKLPFDSLSHLASTFLQPLTLPFDMLMQKLFGEGYMIQESYLAKLYESNFVDIFNPMGGWYIVSDFVHYGYFGILPMCIYIYITWYFSRLYLDSRSFPFGAFFIFIAVKANPFVYWKFVFYILVASVFYKLLNSFKAGSLVRAPRLFSADHPK